MTSSNIRATLLACIAIALLCTSCATTTKTRLQQLDYSQNRREITSISLPEVGIWSEAQLGNTMLENGRKISEPALILLEPVYHEGFSTSPYALSVPTDVMLGKGRTKKGDVIQGVFFEASKQLLFTNTKNDVTAMVFGGIFVPNGDNKDLGIYWRPPNALGTAVIDPNPSINFELTSHGEWVPGYIRRELQYVGLTKSSIKLLYREYNSDDQIRPAFTQELTYDLEQGETIGCKGAQIQVRHADNIKIVFKVLKHFPIASTN